MISCFSFSSVLDLTKSEWLPTESRYGLDDLVGEPILTWLWMKESQYETARFRSPGEACRSATSRNIPDDGPDTQFLMTVSCELWNSLCPAKSWTVRWPIRELWTVWHSIPAVFSFTPLTLLSRPIQRFMLPFSVVRAFVSVLLPAPWSPTMKRLMVDWTIFSLLTGFLGGFAPCFRRSLIISVLSVRDRGVDPSIEVQLGSALHWVRSISTVSISPCLDYKKISRGQH